MIGSTLSGEARNLEALIEAVDGLEQGTLPPETYYSRVGRVRTLTELGVELFKTEVVQTRVQTLPPEQQAMAHATAEQIGVFFEACKRLQAWRPADPFDDLRAALEQARGACAPLQELQRRAIELAEQERLERELEQLPE